MATDFEGDILANLNELTPALPEYWVAELGVLSERDLRASWAVRLAEETIPPVTLDNVFRWLGSQLGATLGAVRAEYQQRLRDIREDEPETHGDWARWYLAAMAFNFASEGMFWVFSEADNIFHSLTVEDVAGEMSNQRGKNCTRRSDYTAIAGLAYSIRARETRAMRLEPPAGVAVQDQFYRMSAEGLIKEKLTLDHYARFKIDAKPRKLNGLFTEFMKQVSDKDQQTLLRQHFAGVLFGIQWTMQKTVLWYGPGATGKSTLQRILESMVPKELISSVPPSDWEKEYHTAAMAGMVLNVVGEIEDRSPLGAAFKNVTGGGRVSARHPTQQPFNYVSKAAQVFCSNYLPPSTDKTDAFWRRWSVVEFRHVIEEGARDPYLATDIASKELGCVLAFALQGAKEIIKASTEGRWRYSTTARQKEIEALWASEINSVLAFLEDDDIVILGKDLLCGKILLYKAYSVWCMDNNQRPLGRNKFGREMAQNVGKRLEIGPGRAENGSRVWLGVGLLSGREREIF